MGKWDHHDDHVHSRSLDLGAYDSGVLTIITSIAAAWFEEHQKEGLSRCYHLLPQPGSRGIRKWEFYHVNFLLDQF